MDILDYIQIVLAGLEILADCDGIHIMRLQVFQQSDDFFFRLTQADHQAGLGIDRRVSSFDILQQLQRARVACLWTDLAVQTRDSLNIVVVHMRFRVYDDLDIGLVP